MKGLHNTVENIKAEVVSRVNGLEAKVNTLEGKIDNVIELLKSKFVIYLFETPF